MEYIADVAMQTSDGKYLIPNTMDDAYTMAWGRDLADLSATAGLKMEGSLGMTSPGVMNAIFGPEVFNLAYKRAVSLSAIGTKPYRTGYRFHQERSTTNSVAGFSRGGLIPRPNEPKYAHVLMPYKQLGHALAMQNGFTALPGIDDVLSWEQHMNFEGLTFLISENRGVTWRIEDDPPLGLDLEGNPNTEIVGFEALERIVSNADEAQYLPDGHAVPWKNTPEITSGGTDHAKYRAQGAVAAGNGGSNFDSYVDHAYDAGTTTGAATLRPFEMRMLNKAFLATQAYGSTNTNAGKVILTGFDTLEKIQMELNFQQRYLDVKFAEMTVNGARTVEGRNTGFAVASYWNSPILPDMQIGRGFGKMSGANANDGIGRILIIDTNQTYRGSLLPPKVEVASDFFRVGTFNRAAIISEVGEIQSTTFRQNAKLLHLK